MICSPYLHYFGDAAVGAGDILEFLEVVAGKNAIRSIPGAKMCLEVGEKRVEFPQPETLRYVLSQVCGRG